MKPDTEKIAIAPCLRFCISAHMTNGEPGKELRLESDGTASRKGDTSEIPLGK